MSNGESARNLKRVSGFGDVLNEHYSVAAASPPFFNTATSYPQEQYALVQEMELLLGVCFSNAM